MRIYLTTLGALAAVAVVGYLLLPLPPATPPRAYEVASSKPRPREVPVERLAPLKGAHVEDAPAYEHQTEWLASGVERLEGPFPADRVIAVHVAPNGTPVEVGQALDRLFTPWGLRMKSGRASSFVAADAYQVSSESGGLSAANLRPRWTADLFLRFVDPETADAAGEPQLSASEGLRCRDVNDTEEGDARCDFIGAAAAPVTRVGFYVAHVYPKGTGLAAYDEEGNELGRILTRTTGTDYLGLASRVPIASVRVFAVDRVDGNFTIDDIRFAR